MEAGRIHFATQPWEPVMDGVRQKSASVAGKRLRLVEYSAAMPEHWCERGHAGLVLEGRMELESAAGTVVLGPGDGLLLADGPAQRHRARLLSEKVLVFYVDEA